MSFKQHLEQMSFDDLIPLWNECCAQYRQEDMIYGSIEEFAELYGEDGVELARKVFFGSVDNWYDKVYLDGYGNFRSCYSIESSPIDIYALVDFMKEVDHPTYLDWRDDQPSFAEWLEEEVDEDTLLSLCSKYIGHDVDEFDIDELAQKLEANDDELYREYLDETM
mgnify:CR=1 FL=1|jgi:hypothetical protein